MPSGSRYWVGLGGQCTGVLGGGALDTSYKLVGWRRTAKAVALVTATVAGMVFLTGCDASPSPVDTPTAVDAPTATTPATAVLAPTTAVEPTAAEESQLPVDTPSAEPVAEVERPFVLTSPAFDDGGMIPTTYTCDGQDLSPELQWQGAPDGTVSFVLICDDPDAPRGTWVHWVVYNIPPDVRMIAESVSPEPLLLDGSAQGKNSWPRTGYGGPCPPCGTHHYVFSLYALDIALQLSPETADKAAVLSAMEGHELGQATLTGLYER